MILCSKGFALRNNNKTQFPRLLLTPQVHVEQIRMNYERMFQLTFFAEPSPVPPSHPCPLVVFLCWCCDLVIWQLRRLSYCRTRTVHVTLFISLFISLSRDRAWGVLLAPNVVLRLFKKGLMCDENNLTYLHVPWLLRAWTCRVPVDRISTVR